MDGTGGPLAVRGSANTIPFDRLAPFGWDRNTQHGTKIQSYFGYKQILDTIQNLTNSDEMSDPASLLRENGIPVTAQRLAVLQAVSNRSHSTADAITEDVRARIGAISRQAVYDALGMLTKKGLIRRIQPAGSSALYEDRVGDNHHHVICRTCEKTVDVDCAVGFAPCLTAANVSGYRIDEAEVIYWGTCPDCLADT